MSSYDDDDDALKAKVKLITTAALFICSGIYHHFATESRQITGVQLANKEEKVYYKCSGSGKNRSCHWEHDYYYYLKDGRTLRDESSIWDGKFGDGKYYSSVDTMHIYDFKTNHDKLFNSDNVLEITNAAPTVTTPSYNRVLESAEPDKPRFA